MILRRLRQSLSNNDGAATPLILGILLLVLLVFAILFQYLYTLAVVNSIQESCRSAAKYVLLANTEASYQAKRVGFTGIWQLEDEEIINASVNFWGYDVNHDWPWWHKQVPYFLPYLLG